MSRSVKIFLLITVPVLAVLLGWLGVMTLAHNPLGWFLLLVGIAFTAGLLALSAIRKERFLDPTPDQPATHEEHGDRSFWYFALGMAAVFYLSPVEYLYFAPVIPRSAWLASGGAALAAWGTALFIWARHALGQNYSGHISVKAGQTLVQSGPYRFIRHPAYAGYLCMALGISLGYSSLAGLGAVLALLLPSMIYRMRVEDRLLAAHFGEAYRRYARTTRRLIPGLW